MRTAPLGEAGRLASEVYHRTPLVTARSAPERDRWPLAYTLSVLSFALVGVAVLLLKPREGLSRPEALLSGRLRR